MRAVRFTQQQLDDGVLVRAKGKFRPIETGTPNLLPYNTVGLLYEVFVARPYIWFEVGPNRLTEVVRVPWRCIELVQ